MNLFDLNKGDTIKKEDQLIANIVCILISIYIKYF